MRFLNYRAQQRKSNGSSSHVRYYLIEGPINQVDKKTEGGEAGRGCWGNGSMLANTQGTMVASLAATVSS